MNRLTLILMAALLAAPVSAQTVPPAADPNGLVPITQGCCAGNDVIPSWLSWGGAVPLWERLRAALQGVGR